MGYERNLAIQQKHRIQQSDRRIRMLETEAETLRGARKILERWNSSLECWMCEIDRITTDPRVRHITRRALSFLREPVPVGENLDLYESALDFIKWERRSRTSAFAEGKDTPRKHLRKETRDSVVSRG
ncbi:hypothetical protein [Aminiphilus circumscriptus]|uniref:hypothetical protein n=1 Tax=Aminiphilus circumscriptus TaxID=290732 RepID=UPI0004786459|nr:hypothetical protein [Aminiphilus circumscriptus]